MKRILLASASMFAFAGVANAEVIFGGSATLGYNDTVNDFDDNNTGFYWSGNIDVTLAQELDNGVAVAIGFDFDFADDNLGEDLVSGSYLLALTTDTAALFFGDTSFAAQTYWVSAGDMEADSFSDADGETVLRGEIQAYGIVAGASYVVADAGGDLVNENGDVDQLSLGMNGTFGMFSVAAAFQEDSNANGDYNPRVENGDFVAARVYGVSAGASFAGADFRLAYAMREGYDGPGGNGGEDISSTGIQASYPIGPVTLTAYYVLEDDNDDEDDNYGFTAIYSSGPIAVTLDYDNDQNGGNDGEGGAHKIGLDGSYDLGNGVSILAGYYAQDNETGFNNDNEYYIATDVDLGGGASFLASYAYGPDNGDDEIGGPDYQEGTTVELSFEF